VTWTGHEPECGAGDDNVILTGTGHARCASCGAGLEEAACETCGGDGVIEIDAADRRGEHYTITRPCPACGDGDERGHAFPDPDDPPDPRDDGDGEVNWDSPE
jgi:hypothetical protein